MAATSTVAKARRLPRTNLALPKRPPRDSKGSNALETEQTMGLWRDTKGSDREVRFGEAFLIQYTIHKYGTRGHVCF